MMLANELKTASTLALLLIFVISPVADTFAFLTGSPYQGQEALPEHQPEQNGFGRGRGRRVRHGRERAPVLAVYGVLGLCIRGRGQRLAGTPWVFFAVLGLITSLLTEFGDLVESVIKRRLGVKDMGRLLPGHGGVLDRIDGTLFASMIVYILFALFITPVATVVP